jgi:hypothetical protein
MSHFFNDNTTHELFEIQRVVLENVSLAIQTQLPGWVCTPSNTKLTVKTATDHVVVNFIRHVAAQTAKQHIVPVSFESPSTWWQAFKKQYYPNWALQLFPVQYTTTYKEAVVHVRVVYPDVVMPDRYHEVLVSHHHTGFAVPGEK